MRLTKANVAKLALPTGKSEVIFFDDDMPGFGLRLRSGGKRVWVVQYRLGAKTRRMTIGTPETLSPERARIEAARVLSTVTLGGDPQADKIAARQPAAATFSEIVPAYLAAVRKKQRPAYHRSVKLYLETHWRPLDRMPLDTITRAAVAKRLGELSKEKGLHSADRARANLSAFFAWAIGEGLAGANPVAGTNRPIEPVSRDRVLSYAELRLVWQSLGSGDYAAIVKLLILTGCRRDEVAGMFRAERRADLWTIPGERTKNGLPHEVPLQASAVAILDFLPARAGRDRVFGGGEGSFSGWSKSKARLDARMLATIRETDPDAKLRPWRLHDLRRTVATRMGELGVLPHVVEAVLNHVSGSKAGVAGVYNRAAYGPEKRAALDLWATHVAGLLSGPQI